jgi:hypothetical protein
LLGDVADETASWSDIRRREISTFATLRDLSLEASAESPSVNPGLGGPLPPEACLWRNERCTLAIVECGLETIVLAEDSQCSGRPSAEYAQSIQTQTSLSLSLFFDKN